MPFGEILVEQRVTSWKSRYTFSGKEKDEESNYSYFGARYYDSDISIWLTVDPMASQYPSLTPYAYCANNPVVLEDPDGRKIRFAKGSSAQFKAAFKASIEHLNKHQVGGIASSLEKSNRTYYIAETSGGSNFTASTTEEATIYWDPSLGLATEEGAMLSPTTILNHEMTHALTFDAAMDKGKVKEYVANSKKGSDPDYDSKNEKWIITRSEQNTAKALGEIGSGQVTRKNHRGKLFHAESVISNKPKVIELPKVKVVVE
jgi:RHS repeat-associated protein